MNKGILHTMTAVCLTGALLIAQPLFADGNYRVVTANENYTITDRLLGDTEIVVAGHLPEFKVSDPLFSRQVNDKVEAFYNGALAKAGEMAEENLVVIFSYDVFGNAKAMSVALHAMTISGNNRFEELTAFVLDKEGNKFLTLKDILGPEGFAIADKVIGDAIKAAEPSEYFRGENGFERFKGVNEQTKFYVDGSNVIVFFDKYEIAPGYMGRPSFVIPLAAEEEQPAADGAEAEAEEGAAEADKAAADGAAEDKALQEQKLDQELFPLG